jgi:hemerythrin superfamily protein
MPKSKSHASKDQPLALALLMADHRDVENLFERYQQGKDDDVDTRRRIAKQICDALTVHAQVEEELLYPWLRETLAEDDQDMVEEAQVEHNGVKDLVVQIEAADDVDASFDAMVKVLGEYVRHHVKEEESRIFPAVSSEREALDEIGREIVSRRTEIKEELGVFAEEGDDDEDDVREPSHAGQRGRNSPRPQRTR